MSHTRRRLTALRKIGPRGLILLACAAVWTGFGVGTLEDYAGRPTDAPHLRIDHVWRGWVLWIVPALAAAVLVIVAAHRPTDRLRLHRAAIGCLWVGMSVRAVSYSVSWILSWSWIDDLTPTGSILDGSRSAGYGSLTWWLGLLTLVMAAWAPPRWSDIYRYQRREREGDQ